MLYLNDFWKISNYFIKIWHSLSDVQMELFSKIGIYVYFKKNLNAVLQTLEKYSKALSEKMVLNKNKLKLVKSN